jgi:hypothetical protein
MNALVDFHVPIRTEFPANVHLGGLRRPKTRSRASSVLLAFIVPIHGILQKIVQPVSFYLYSAPCFSCELMCCMHEVTLYLHLQTCFLRGLHHRRYCLLCYRKTDN